MPVIFLDDVVISEENNGFSVDDFIGYVKNDTTFYLGFKHLRYYEHKYKSELNVYNKKYVKIGTLNRIGTHYSDNKKAFTLDNSVYFFGADHNMQSNTDGISLINTNGVSLGSTHSSIL